MARSVWHAQLRSQSRKKLFFSPGGAIGLIEDGDEIAISIPDRSMTLCISDEELAARRARRDELGWYPESREREVSQSLKIYASLAQSADRGAARRRI